MEWPLITIAMAIYKPNMDWFKRQLTSLDRLNYENLELLIWDDCPENYVEENFIRQYITSFPVHIYHEDVNLGSTKAFEKLTSYAKGEYIAYCDQDDVWHEDKLKNLLHEFTEDSTLSMVCSNMAVIDDNDHKIADSITEVRPRQVGYNGPDMVDYMLTHYFVVGCTILIKSTVAKVAMPFAKNMVHDYWLGIYSATYGKLKYVDKPLISYRIHSGQQTGIFGDVIAKNDYYENRLLVYEARMREIANRLVNSKAEASVQEKLIWAQVRIAWSKKQSVETLIFMLKYCSYNWRISLFEVFLPFMPAFVWKIVVNRLKE